MSGARVLITGASGALGSKLARSLYDSGARLAVAGRDPERLEATAHACGDAPKLRFDAMDVDRCRKLPAEAASVLGGLEAVVAAHGVAGFGAAAETDDADTEHLMLVNALSPIALLSAAIPQVGPGGALAAITAILVDRPTAGMASYSASKAALAGWLTAVRAELRPERVQVLDIRAPHMDTGLIGRAITGGTPTALPKPFDRDVFASAVVTALSEGTGVLHFDPRSGRPDPR